jgi:uncharacterized RDD family membrane protein YckC
MTDAPPAGFWIRVLGALVDGVVVLLVQLSLALIATRLFGADVTDDLAYQSGIVLFTLLFTLLYTSTMHAVSGQTVGKMVARVRVVGLDGELPTFGTAVLRYFGYFVSLLPLTLGYLMAGLRRDKRALHDLIAGTRVERVLRPAPTPPAPVEPVLAADEPSPSGYL